MTINKNHWPDGQDPLPLTSWDTPDDFDDATETHHGQHLNDAAIKSALCIMIGITIILAALAHYFLKS